MRFASKVLSHSHRALARCYGHAVLRHRFNGFAGGSAVDRREGFLDLHRSCTGLKPGENERGLLGQSSDDAVRGLEVKRLSAEGDAAARSFAAACFIVVHNRHSSSGRIAWADVRWTTQRDRERFISFADAVI